MTQRLNILKQHGLGLNDIQAVIADMGHCLGRKSLWNGYVLIFN